MPGKLVIVESPAKAKTIERYLGPGYEVRASLGHVRDLPKSKLGVDIDHGFEPEYLVPRDKLKQVKDLRARAQKADEIILATDPDREGEAIAWHLVETIEPGNRPVRRVEFHEITRSAVTEAMKRPRSIDLKRVDAQQARRILDRLVGYQISPLLWKKVQRGLSAGRVQSAALRLVVEREREVQAFTPVEYWSVEADLAKTGQTSRPRGQVPASFTATLLEVNGTKAEIVNEPAALTITADLEGAKYAIDAVRKRQQQRQPPAPFTTSTLQQEASRRLGFGVTRTMVVAQQLYEGVALGDEGEVGLITYMRTDSTQMADAAVQEARRFITEKHGPENVSPEPRTYRTRSRLAQEAHEAIRATSAFRTPEEATRFLSRDQARLYELIWKRFVATQMAAARLEITSVDIDATRDGSSNRYQFRAAGSVVTFPGFLSLYQEARDEDAAATDEDRQPLPPLEKGEVLDLISLTPEQHLTQPPPRFTEASLVKALEERGIGRPSTYAPTISTLKDRNYVEVESRRLQATPLGSLVTDLLIEHFPTVVDVDFTAGMEEQLDDIAEGRSERVPVLREFYGPFLKALTAAETQMERPTEATDEKCEKCGHPMVIKFGRFGRFLACTGYPECRNTRPLEPPAEPTDEKCEKCGRPLVIKFGRFGRFLACTGYPECKNARPILVKVGALCPKCEAPIVQRRTKKGRTFYGCSRYPECDWTSWSRPLEQPCPSCGGLLVESGRERAKCTQCGKIIPVSELEPVQEAAAR